MLLQAVSYNKLPDFTFIKSQIKRIVWVNVKDEPMYCTKVTGVGPTL